MDLIDAANKIYFKNIAYMLNLKDIDNLTITSLYTELHHYCELMMRYLVIQKNPSKNLKVGSSLSVNAIELIDIIKELYPINFLSENKVNYCNFKSFFKQISNLRNSYSHAGKFFEDDKNINDVLNDYIVCFYVLNKDGDFINNYYNYLKDNITSKNHESVKDVDISLSNKKENKENILYNHINDFLKIFSLSKYNKILFDIDNCFMKICCPNCPNYTFGYYRDKQMTFVKTHKDLCIFKCYICNYSEEMKPVNCEQCFFDGIRQPLAYNHNEICLFCQTEDTLSYMPTYNIKYEILEKNIYHNFVISKKVYIGIYYNSKNNYKNIHNIRMLENVFKAYNEKDNNNVRLYISYWKNFFSYKNCVHNYLNKNINLNNYFPLFTDNLSKKSLFQYTLKEVNFILDYLISKVDEPSIIEFINNTLYPELVKIIYDNIYSLNGSFEKGFKDDVFCEFINNSRYL